MTIGAVCNVYNECHALPGWLESACAVFDWVGVVHAGPRGAASTDGTMEILGSWQVPVMMTSIDKGFGYVRSLCVEFCPCDWVMVMDADERFLPLVRYLEPVGTHQPRPVSDQTLQEYDGRSETFPANWENARLLTDAVEAVPLVGPVIEQKTAVMKMMDKDVDAIVLARRHWQDFRMKTAAYNWNTFPDYQMRLIRRASGARFVGKLHESVVGIDPDRIVTWPQEDPFLEHFHLPFKAMEPTQREHDIRIYRAIHAGSEVPQS